MKHNDEITIDKTLVPKRWRRVLRPFTKKKVYIPLLLFIGVHVWIHFSNPYMLMSYFEQPYSTYIENDKIAYKQIYEPKVLADPVSDLLGYYKSGFLIVQNTLTGGKEIRRDTPQEIISEIHKKRFDPSKPYLISGDQFSVLYPRNLGVFYNTLLDPNTAHNKQDWENRQRIYLQSVLFAVDGLSVADTPRTTLVPIAPRTMTATTVHPGDIASDATYGVLYAISVMNTEKTSRNGEYSIQTKPAIERVLREKKDKLARMVDVYLKNVQDPETKLVRTDKKLSSARDGITRSGSMYDNIILWKTIQLANKLGIRETPQQEIDALQQKIKSMYWDDVRGHYHNDVRDMSFSSDFLIGYPTGFFDLNNPTDFARTKQIIRFIEKNGIASPLPIKYQIGEPLHMPYMVKKFVSTYGGEAIWSYWGAQYITLLADMHHLTGDVEYQEIAKKDIKAYNEAIVRDGGFAETFHPDGTFLRSGLYKSIRITGWVVQYEHAQDVLATPPVKK